nr:hypothetical protein B0A51_02545 [Rachicladosporium sp. CCFEE 5018]
MAHKSTSEQVRQEELDRQLKRSVMIKKGFGPLTYPDEKLLKKAHEIAEDTEGSNRSKTSVSENDVRRFKDTHLRSRQMVGHRPNAEIKRVQCGFLLVKDPLDDVASRKVLKDWPIVTTSNLQGHTELVQKYVRDAHAKTSKTNLKGMKRLVEKSGGIEAWKQASDEQIRDLLTCLFDEFPLNILKLVFWYEDEAVAMERIWRCSFDDEKWQHLFRTKFVDLAQFTWEHRIKTKKSGHAVQLDDSTGLKLSEVYNIPSRPHRSHGKENWGSFTAEFGAWYRKQ